MNQKSVFGRAQLQATKSVPPAVKPVGKLAVLALAVTLAACSSPADAPLPLDVDIQVADAVASVQGGDAQMLLNVTVTNRESGPVLVGPICTAIEVRGEDGELLFNSTPLACDIFNSAPPVPPGESAVFENWPVRAPIGEWGSSVAGQYRVGIPATAEGRQSSAHVVSNSFAVTRE